MKRLAGSRAAAARLASGDQSALAEFYDLYAGLANGLALRILRDSSDAEDVVQEAFVQVWRQAGRYDPGRGSPQAWLCTIARTRALDRLRRRASRREDVSDEPPAISETPQTEEAIAVRKRARHPLERPAARAGARLLRRAHAVEIALRLGERSAPSRRASVRP
jgi:RNA polymerase sigma-70 factor (ECF subfamily)